MVAASPMSRQCDGDCRRSRRRPEQRLGVRPDTDDPSPSGTARPGGLQGLVRAACAASRGGLGGPAALRWRHDQAIRRWPSSHGAPGARRAMHSRRRAPAGWPLAGERPRDEPRARRHRAGGSRDCRGGWPAPARCCAGGTRAPPHGGQRRVQRHHRRNHRVAPPGTRPHRGTSGVHRVARRGQRKPASSRAGTTTNRTGQGAGVPASPLG
jgi:hypothetical protein